MKKDNEFYRGKTVLVTGGAGSIGSVLVKILLEKGVHRIRVFDNNETGLFNLGRNTDSEKIRLFIGDIRDSERIKLAVENVDIVFHAAALKHVPLCEFNPFEAAQTNVAGTQNLINASIAEKVDKFITISTDKAVNPINVMGASKLLAEKLTVSANRYKGDRETSLSCVRFGNVLNSQGSVIPIFKEQIKKGIPITITHPEMTRFVMKVENAVELVLLAAERAEGSEIFILKMPAIKISDLAQALIDEAFEQNKIKSRKYEINYIGKRPGEKIYEELLSEAEVGNSIELDDMFVINTYHKTEDNVRIRSPYRSDVADYLNRSEIRELIREI